MSNSSGWVSDGCFMEIFDVSSLPDSQLNSPEGNLPGKHSVREAETGDSGWTRENLHKLFTAMKRNIPERERRLKYDRSLKSLDWNKVAFPPFSPGACKQKWTAILHKMRKIRSLTELLDEAEDVILKPLKKHELKLHPQAPKKPRPPSSMYFEENHANLRKQHPKLKPTMLFKLALSQYKNLPKQEKAFYKDKYNRVAEEYELKMDQFRKQYAIKLKTVKKTATPADITTGEEGLPLQPASVENGLLHDEWTRCLQTLSETEKQQNTQRFQESFNQETQTMTFYENAVGLLEEKRFPCIKTEPVHMMAASDTEDEDLEESSSEEEPNYMNFQEEEEEEDDDTDNVTL